MSMTPFTPEDLTARGFVLIDGTWVKGKSSKRRVSKPARPRDKPADKSPLIKALDVLEKLPPSKAFKDQPTKGAFGTIPDKYAGMNKLEKEWALRLEAEKQAGEIHDWWYESIVFRLADRTTYRPDFMVIWPDGRVIFYEVKGFMRDDAAVKLKVVNEMFPFEFFLCRKKKGMWEVKKVGKQKINSCA